MELVSFLKNVGIEPKTRCSVFEQNDRRQHKADKKLVGIQMIK